MGLVDQTVFRKYQERIGGFTRNWRMFFVAWLRAKSKWSATKTAIFARWIACVTFQVSKSLWFQPPEIARFRSLFWSSVHWSWSMLVPTDLVENHMANAKCFSFLMFPTKNSMNINPLSHPHTKISTRSRKIMSVRRSAHLLLGHHASRQELKSWKKQRILRGFDLFLPHVYSSYCFIINKFPLYITLYPSFYCYLFL